MGGQEIPLYDALPATLNTYSAASANDCPPPQNWFFRSVVGQQVVIDIYTLLTYSDTTQTVIETEIYLRDAKATGMSDTERTKIVNFLAANPDAGDEIKT